MFRLHLIYCILLLFTWTYAQDVSVKISESKPVYLTNVSYDLFLENATSAILLLSMSCSMLVSDVPPVFPMCRR